jgi:hypothetical protein
MNSLVYQPLESLPTLDFRGVFPVCSDLRWEWERKVWPERSHLEIVGTGLACRNEVECFCKTMSDASPHGLLYVGCPATFYVESFMIPDRPSR